MGLFTFIYRSRLSRALRLTRVGKPPTADPRGLPGIPVPAARVRCLMEPAALRAALLEGIGSARRRIFITALYLQDDVAGREIMDALHAASRAHPGLEIVVLVDWHRAQRGLIGKTRSRGNAAMYQDYAAKAGGTVAILGVPVQTREVFGVLHFKGFIFDDTVIYTGASLNEVYLDRLGRYRLDRYHVLESPALADAMVDYLRRVLLASPAVTSLTQPHLPGVRTLRGAIHDLRRRLRDAHYAFAVSRPAPGEVGVTPLAGFGRSGNTLNASLLALVQATERSLILYTPYFNLPRSLNPAISRLLDQGREITIVVGDKTANDFYLPPSEPFRLIGLVPYLYEANLRRFALKHRDAMEAGRLNIHLWRHEGHTFHAKGLLIDGRIAVLTGNNLNPRAWNLDLENGLVIRDAQGLLTDMHAQEREAILAHTTRLGGSQDLETLASYPQPVQKALKRMNRIRLDRFANRLL
jgi:CDP-diacylglycerol---serine O-phosphatidyltransferase